MRTETRTHIARQVFLSNRKYAVMSGGCHRVPKWQSVCKMGGIFGKQEMSAEKNRRGQSSFKQ